MASNGICQDGGPGAEYHSQCPLGHDCADCGTRNYAAANFYIEQQDHAAILNIQNNTENLGADLGLLSSKMNEAAGAAAGAAAGMVIFAILGSLCCCCAVIGTIAFLIKKQNQAKRLLTSHNVEITNIGDRSDV